ncbi:MAG: hypothetical protein ACYTF6_05980 [Planctomycetota bacterium]|jgi:zinc protease
MRSICTAILGVALAAVTPAAAAGGDHFSAEKRLYVVAVSDATYADQDWRQVVDALVEKHAAKLVRYRGDVTSARDALAAWMPDYICFVARPQEAGRKFVVTVSRMTRKLDEDYFTDALWGILTGYEPADALRIAKRREPLVITRAASGVGPGLLGGFESGFASAETSQKNFWTKNGEEISKQQLEPDPAEALARAFNTMRPQIFFTSGHATEHDWQIGYRIRAGQFRHKKGQLVSINTKGKVFEIHSPEPKVYLPMGNCLIGHIDRRDCMVTAWIHSGGVYQMYGYTAVTWNGRMGWGTKNRFMGGIDNLSEAFYWTNQDLLRTLHEKYPKVAEVDFETYRQGRMGDLARRHKLIRPNPKTKKPELWREPMALLWDRDCVAFYGDPAWDARLPRRELSWKQEWAGGGGSWTLTITPEKDGAGPGSLWLFLPERLTDVEVVEGKGLVAVITDNFIIARPKPEDGYKKGQAVEIKIKGTPMVRPRDKRGQEPF